MRDYVDARKAGVSSDFIVPTDTIQVEVLRMGRSGGQAVVQCHRR
ncbi:hypothetical protein [Paraburkholderia diazotrophica]